MIGGEENPLVGERLRREVSDDAWEKADACRPGSGRSRLCLRHSGLHHASDRSDGWTGRP